MENKVQEFDWEQFFHEIGRLIQFFWKFLMVFADPLLRPSVYIMDLVNHGSSPLAAVIIYLMFAVPLGVGFLFLFHFCFVIFKNVIYPVFFVPALLFVGLITYLVAGFFTLFSAEENRKGQPTMKAIARFFFGVCDRNSNTPSQTKPRPKPISQKPIKPVVAWYISQDQISK